MKVSRRTPPAIRLSVGAEVLGQLLARWRASDGAEPCGVILGRRDAAGTELREVCALTNAHPRPTGAFLLTPEDQLAARRLARDRGLEVVALWHGHLKGPPVPSDEDGRGLERASALGAAPELMLLVGRGQGGIPVIRAWRVQGPLARELHLRLARTS